MKHLFKEKYIKIFLLILVTLLIVKLLWLVVEVMFLPTKGVTHIEEVENNSLYYRVKLTPKKIAVPRKVIINPTVKKVRRTRGSDIKDIELLAIYNSSKVTIVTVNYKKKSKVLSKGESIDDFELKGAGQGFATFAKDNNLYKVSLSKKKSSKKSTSRKQRNNKSSLKKESKEERSDDPNGISDAGDHKIIDRSLLNHYASNPKNIYKDISIAEVRTGEKINGFKIKFVRKGSAFEKLDLAKNDIIKSINGQEITSYNSAMKIYKNIKNVDNITLGIVRGVEKMDLEYEID